MKKIIFPILILLFSNVCNAQKYSSQRPYLRDVFEVFDYVHRTLYDDDAKTCEKKIRQILSNEYFTSEDRKTMNQKGENLLGYIMAVKSSNEGYYFQYCYIPLERMQTEKTYSWYNKNNSRTSTLNAKMENGTMRIVSLDLVMEGKPEERKNLNRYSCTQTTIGAVVRGKRIGLSEQKYDQPVLAYHNESDYWQEATYLGKSEDGYYMVEYPNKVRMKATQIVPIDILPGDLAYFLHDNELKRVVIAAVENTFISLAANNLNIVVSRKNLYFKINTYEAIDTESQLFISN